MTTNNLAKFPNGIIVYGEVESSGLPPLQEDEFY